MNQSNQGTSPQAAEQPRPWEQKVSQTVRQTVKKGISFGSALAMVISFTTWHSVGWAILHGLLGWVYVIYYVIRY